jgi:hypothetical protein
MRSKWTLERLVGGVWSGFIWLRIGIIDGLLWMRWWTFGFWRDRVSWLDLYHFVLSLKHTLWTSVVGWTVVRTARVNVCAAMCVGLLWISVGKVYAPLVWRTAWSTSMYTWINSRTDKQTLVTFNMWEFYKRGAEPFQFLFS